MRLSDWILVIAANGLRLGVLLAMLMFSAPALAGSLTISPDIISGGKTATTFAIDVVIKDVTDNGDNSEKAAIEKLYDESKAKSLFQIMLGNESTNGLPYEGDAEDTDAMTFTEDSAKEGPIRETNGKYTYTFHLRINVPKSIAESDILVGGKVQIKINFVAGDKKIAVTDPPKQLVVGNYVANSSPRFPADGVKGSYESLIVSWDIVDKIPAKDGSRAANIDAFNIDVFVIDKDALPLNLAAQKVTDDDTVTPAICPVSALVGACACAGNEYKETYIDTETVKASLPVGVWIKSVKVASGSVTFSNDLVNGHEYLVFAQYQPTGIKRSLCLSGIPKANLSLTEAYGEGKATPADFRCFIATAAYGSPLHHDVALFRLFRDRVLMHWSIGRALVSAYYQYSPPLADFIAAHPWAKRLTRWVLSAPALILEKVYGGE